jgi:hypothetical protein
VVSKAFRNLPLVSEKDHGNLRHEAGRQRDVASGRPVSHWLVAVVKRPHARRVSGVKTVRNGYYGLDWIVLAVP